MCLTLKIEDLWIHNNGIKCTSKKISIAHLHFIIIIKIEKTSQIQICSHLEQVHGKIGSAQSFDNRYC